MGSALPDQTASWFLRWCCLCPRRNNSNSLWTETCNFWIWYWQRWSEILYFIDRVIIVSHFLHRSKGKMREIKRQQLPTWLVKEFSRVRWKLNLLFLFVSNQAKITFLSLSSLFKENNSLSIQLLTSSTQICFHLNGCAATWKTGPLQSPDGIQLQAMMQHTTESLVFAGTCSTACKANTQGPIRHIQDLSRDGRRV